MRQRLRRVVRVCRRLRGYAASHRRASRKVQGEGGDREGSSSLTKRSGEQGDRCCVFVVVRFCVPLPVSLTVPPFSVCCAAFTGTSVYTPTPIEAPKSRELGSERGG